jgi:hypothetical protein
MTHESNAANPAPQEHLSLDDLAHRIRTEFAAVRKAAGLTLGHAMTAGDYLNQAQERVTTNWKKWLHDNHIIVSTAQLYQQLARYRPVIEAAMALNPDLSIRDARRLTSTPKRAPLRNRTS